MMTTMMTTTTDDDERHICVDILRFISLSFESLCIMHTHPQLQLSIS